MKKIALFGTSADPPTAGHQSILRWLAIHYDLVVVWASDNPFKQHQTPLNRRSEMLRLVIEEIDVPQDNISLRQQLSDRYTLNTVNKAREIWQDNTEFTLVIGADILPQITSWYRIEELLAKVKILIIPRSGYDLDRADLKSLEAIGGQYTIASLDVPQVSSSAYRSQGDNRVITPAVENYISQQRLYAARTKAGEKV
ncbi:nicotinate-nucleotide adenylyltransferase [Myxosarcina sp. GI1]|uniref:nicotinate-nucleotide adenylyltransferase n=1 Tax=Myxosarcina sp. GI1 TaxID=1541065 RepID=UPI00056A4510|nr:nicotinate-nucleotide adenylyltransferase [Myxosarcina sp. GI1]